MTKSEHWKGPIYLAISRCPGRQEIVEFNVYCEEQINILYLRLVKKKNITNRSFNIARLFEEKVTTIEALLLENLERLKRSPTK